MTRVRFYFGLAGFFLVWFISLFEKSDGENTSGEKTVGLNTERGKDLAWK